VSDHVLTQRARSGAIRANGKERVGIIGFGRIGQRIARSIGARSEGLELSAVLVRNPNTLAVRDIAGDVVFSANPAELLNADLDVVVECASAGALLKLAPPLLFAGCDVIPLSLGAFADPAAEALLMAAARKGPGRIEIPAGAMGSIGFLAAAREHGLRDVSMKIAYPIERWRGMGAEKFTDLDIRQPATFMRGSVRDIALRFPGHLNVAASVALAGLGFDRTQVELIADPDISQAWFEINAVSDSGPVHLRVDGRDAPVEDDPIDYTTFSVIRLLRRRGAPLAI
jgi:aspartate dehydrogenase